MQVKIGEGEKCFIGVFRRRKGGHGREHCGEDFEGALGCGGSRAEESERIFV
jgi:hypothetical protein